jgi:hypothetical protein
VCVRCQDDRNRRKCHGNAATRRLPFVSSMCSPYPAPGLPRVPLPASQAVTDDAVAGAPQEFGGTPENEDLPVKKPERYA